MSDCYLTDNFFELFNIPVSYDVDMELVHQSYMQLQKEVHPDNYVTDSDQQKRISLQQTSRVNEAFNTLKNDVARAAYLLQLKGVDINLSNETTRDMAFLMDQMQTREKLENIRQQQDPLTALDEIAAKEKSAMTEVSRQFIEAYDSDSLEDARECIRKMQFLDKARNQIETLQSDIEDELLG